MLCWTAVNKHDRNMTALFVATGERPKRPCLLCLSTVPQNVKKLASVDLSKVIEEDDNTDLKGELACAGGACEVS